MITLEQAKNLKCGQIIYHHKLKNSDNTKMRFKVNGKVKIWKRNINRIAIPLKHGLYEYGYLVNHFNDYICKGFKLSLLDVDLHE